MMQTALSRDGTRIAFEAGGAGPALVVVNGALSDRRSVTPLRAYLEPHFTVIGYDRRGRGDSGDTAPYAPEREIEDLAAVMAAVAAPAFVYGHSSGGILALRSAASGVAMRRLAVNEPPFILPDIRPLLAPDATARLELLLDSGNREGALRLFLLEQIGLPEAAVEQLSSSPAWPRMIALAHTAAYDSRLAGTAEFSRSAFASLSIRTLVLHGTTNFPWIIATARKLAETLPDAEIAQLEGQPHSPAPDVLAPHLIRFFGSRS
jgi:pimeloyl-ACP methyl ester carboxylesterase